MSLRSGLVPRSGRSSSGRSGSGRSSSARSSSGRTDSGRSSSGQSSSSRSGSGRSSSERETDNRNNDALTIFVIKFIVKKPDAPDLNFLDFDVFFKDFSSREASGEVGGDPYMPRERFWDWGINI